MEIERKFLIKEMPDLSEVIPIKQERYYLERKDGTEERIQKKGDIFEYESKQEISSIKRTRDKKRISVEEFEKLKENADGKIIRDDYKLNDTLSIKIYHDRFEGLKRAEVEFNSEEEALVYKPESWMGKEITESPLGRDSKLLGLSDEEFQTLIKR